jgi:hypothetical protein
LRDFVERLLFRQPDLNALARGWEVHRPLPFRRVYRDPRWDSIAACADCHGTGFAAAHPCCTCSGRGTVRLAGADTAVVR